MISDQQALQVVEWMTNRDRDAYEAVLLKAIHEVFQRSSNVPWEYRDASPLTVVTSASGPSFKVVLPDGHEVEVPTDEVRDQVRFLTDGPRGRMIRWYAGA